MPIRIKQIVNMPAVNTGSATTTTANAYVEAFEAAMLAAGFERSSDTGQLGTITSVPGAGVSAGYRVYRLVDELSTTSPFFLIVEFRNLYCQVPGGSPLTIRPRVSACLATDGAGGAVGPSCLAATYYHVSTNPTGIGSQPNANKGYVWRKEHAHFICLSPGYSYATLTDAMGPTIIVQTAGTLMFARRRDRQGAVVPGEFIVYGTSHEALTGHMRSLGWVRGTLLSSAGAVSIPGGSLSQGLEPAAKFSLADNQPLIQHPFLGRASEDMSAYGVPGIGTYYPASHFTPGSIIPVSVDGETKNYMCLGYTNLGVQLPSVDVLATTTSTSATLYSSSAPIITGHGICLDWDD